MLLVSRNSSTSNYSMTVSTKPWFLTYIEAESDVFVWKDGVRMKLRNGDSAGTVVSVSPADGIRTGSVITQVARSITLLYFCVNLLQFEGKNTAGSKAYKFRCQLDKFDVNANAEIYRTHVHL